MNELRNDALKELVKRLKVNNKYSFMKNLNYCIKAILVVLVLLFSFILESCNRQELDEINERLDRIESEKVEKDSVNLRSFSFLSKDNLRTLISDVQGEIIGDSIVECRVPYIMNDKLLIPHIDYSGTSALLDDVEINDEMVSVDFKKPVNLTLKSENRIKTYTIYVHSFTGLPIVRIETEGRKKIETKEDYIDATFVLEENVRTRGAGDVITTKVQVKGRGNATWKYYPKKPYRLKFQEKLSILGMPKDKSWVLLANYKDRTSLRNWMALFISKLSKLDYTPKSKFVELFLNGEYCGTYQLCEKIKISSNRVNVGSDGYLLEFDEYAKNEEDARCIYTKHLVHPINIKEPECEYGDDKYEYIKDYIMSTEKALYSDNFKDPQNGWRKYLDEESLIEWYWVNEITKNLDGFRCSSTFFNKKADGKLKIGPVWDFDHSFGNYVDNGYGSETFYGWWIRNNGWYKRLFEDESFVIAVNDRFDYYYSKKDILFEEINDYANYLQYSVIENNAKWDTFYHPFSSDCDVWGSYFNEVGYLKKWLQNRLEWIDKVLNEN